MTFPLTNRCIDDASLSVLPYYPSHFMRGTAIRLASGELKRVEQMNTEDFLRSNVGLADHNLSMHSCTLISIQRTLDDDNDTSVILGFSVGEQKQQVMLTVFHRYV